MIWTLVKGSLFCGLECESCDALASEKLLFSEVYRLWETSSLLVDPAVRNYKSSQFLNAILYSKQCMCLHHLNLCELDRSTAAQLIFLIAVGKNLNPSVRLQACAYII